MSTLKLVRAVKDKSDPKADKVAFTVRLDPDNDDDKFKFYVRSFETGDSEDWLEFRKDFARLVSLKDIGDNGPSLFRHIRAVLIGDAVAQFELLADDQEEETPEAFAEVLATLTTEYVPTRTAQRLKRYLRDVRKPSNLTVAQFVARLKLLNSYLPFMPTLNAGDNDTLNEAELQIILEHAVPGSWRHQLVVSGRYKDMDFNDVVAYFKTLENLEEESGRGTTASRIRGGGNAQGAGRNNNTKNGGNGRSSQSNANHNNRNRQGGGGNGGQSRRSQRNKGPWCPVHKTTSHSWDQCYSNPKNQKARPSAKAEANVIEKSAPSEDHESRKGSRKEEIVDSGTDDDYDEAYVIRGRPVQNSHDRDAHDSQCVIEIALAQPAKTPKRTRFRAQKGASGHRLQSLNDKVDCASQKHLREGANANSVADEDRGFRDLRLRQGDLPTPGIHHTADCSRRVPSGRQPVQRPV